MKVNIANPSNGTQKTYEYDDEKKLHIFMDKRMATEVPLDSLGEEFAGYVGRISGGNDKQGFPMRQGILLNQRVRILMSKGHACFRPRRTGERKRKSVRGCIVANDLSVLSLVIVKKGEKEIPGLTDVNHPRRLGPKRASKIRKMFNLKKADDVRRYVVMFKRKVTAKKEGAKTHTKCQKIQRLVTPLVLQRKRHRISLKKKHSEAVRAQAAEYQKVLAQRLKEQRERRHSLLKKRRESQSQSQSEEKPKEEVKGKKQKQESPKEVKKEKETKKDAKKETTKDTKTKDVKDTKSKDTKKPAAPAPTPAAPAPKEQPKPADTKGKDKKKK